MPDHRERQAHRVVRAARRDRLQPAAGAALRTGVAQRRGVGENRATADAPRAAERGGRARDRVGGGVVRSRRGSTAGAWSSIEEEDGEGKNFEAIKDAAAEPLWARFYDIATNQPLFSDMDSMPRLGIENVGWARHGYRWTGDWPRAAFVERIPGLESAPRRERTRARAPTNGSRKRGSRSREIPR